ncbi:S41 family peptidase [Blautia stercoris]
MEKNKVKGFVTGVLCTVLVGGGIFGGCYVLSNKDHAVNQESVQKAKAIENLIDKYYLDKIDNDELESYLYKGLMAGLGDPYSTYYTAEEYKELTEDTEGVYRGIGVTMQKDVSTGAVTVVKCFEGAPGAEAGLQPQDQLVKVNGEDITDKELSEVVKMIKTSESDTVTLTILREGESDYREVEVTLDTVEAPMVEHEMLDNKIGYITINQFAETTASQYETALEDLNNQGMERLIVDVRDNPGGLLTSVCDVLDSMLPEELLVYTEDKNGKKSEYNATGTDQFDKPMVILVNGNSASAAEIFSGALQDYKVAKLVGTTTFGKGIVQQIFNLSDGSAVKMTISKYYTPSGRCIHGTGLEPDIEVDLPDELKNQVSIDKSEDTQLQKAIETVKEMQ